MANWEHEDNDFAWDNEIEIEMCGNCGKTGTMRETEDYNIHKCNYCDHENRRSDWE